VERGDGQDHATPSKFLGVKSLKLQTVIAKNLKIEIHEAHDSKDITYSIIDRVP